MVKSTAKSPQELAFLRMVDIRADIRKRVDKLTAYGIVPGLAVILVGNNAASAVYVATRFKPAERWAEILSVFA